LLSASQRPLYAFIRAQVRTREDAEEVYQETAAAICEDFGTYDPSRPFLAWACGIAWRRVLSHSRNASRLKLLGNQELEQVLLDKYVSAAAEVDARRERLQGCMSRLKPESREIIERHYFQQEGVASIAARLGVSERCVYRTLASIRSVLLDCVTRKLEEDR
jgi:RNA polymerase sigma-70 factor (ECF subfamily)